MSVASQPASVAGPPPTVQERGKKGCKRWAFTRFKRVCGP